MMTAVQLPLLQQDLQQEPKMRATDGLPQVPRTIVLPVITITLLGEPVAFARTRLSRANGMPFTPRKQRNTMASLRLLAQEQMRDRIPFDEPLRLDYTAEFAIGSSWSKKKKAAALASKIYPAKRPDIDNLVKIVKDAMNGIVFRDDALIVAMHCHKVYGDQPQISA